MQLYRGVKGNNTIATTLYQVRAVHQDHQRELPAIVYSVDYLPAGHKPIGGLSEQWPLWSALLLARVLFHLDVSIAIE